MTTQPQSSSTLLGSANAAAAALVSSSTSGTNSTSGTTTTNNALAQLGANFNQFLQLLLTQVQNQDPTSPTDTDEFTTELVQFTGVQEQVNANTSLGDLITLQQGSQILQANGLTGHTAVVNASQITLQNGSGALNIQSTPGQPLGIAIVNAAGQPIYDTTTTATGATTRWTWNGTDNSGNPVPDGAYSVAVQAPTANGGGTPVQFTVDGTITGVASNAGTTQLQLGGLSVGISALQSVTD